MANTGDHLTDSVFSGFRWLSIGKFTGQFISWAVTLIVIRLLTPSDYGLMAMAAIFVAFFEMFSEFGLGAAIVQAKEIDQRIIQQMFGIILLLDVMLFAILFSVAPVVASFFQEPQLILIVRVLAAKFLLIAFSAIPQALLQKNLQFKQRALIDFAANLVGALSTLGLALLGKGVWALVWGSIFLFVVRTIGFNLAHPFFSRPIFSFKGTRSMLSFGGILMAGGILRYTYARADIFIIGKLFGKELLGFFSVGKELSFTLSQKVVPIIHQIVFPAFSQIQDQPDDIAYYTLKGIRLISLAAFPAFWGLSSITPEFTAVVLGSKWIPVMIPLTWISLGVPFGVLNGIIIWILRGIGRADIALKNILTAFIIIPVAIVIGSQWRLEGVSIAWLISYSFYFTLAVFRSSRYMGVKISAIFQITIKQIVSCGIMYGAVVLVRSISQDMLSPLLRLPLLTSVGAVVYLGLQLSINRELLREILDVIKKIIVPRNS